MCLSVNTDIHSYGSSVAPKFAKVPILVWKNLINPDINGAYSPYFCYRWKFGNAEKAPLEVVHDTPFSISIERGLHAHVLSAEQRKNPTLVKRYCTPGRRLWNIDFGKLYPAVIPVGARFFIGKEGDIVAGEMTVYRDEADMFAALGITKLADGIKRETIKTW